MKRTLALWTIAVLYLITAPLVFAQTLTSVTPPPGSATEGLPGWAWALIGIAVIALVAVLVLRRQDPALLANITTAGKSDLTKVEGLLETGFTKLESAIKAHTAAVAPDAVPAPALAAQVPPGKLGAPGLLTLDLTGDPLTDNATFQAAYNAK